MNTFWWIFSNVIQTILFREDKKYTHFDSILNWMNSHKVGKTLTEIGFYSSTQN